MLREGYEQYKDQPFYVPSPVGERLINPSKYVEELKTALVNEVDIVGLFYEVHTSLYPVQLSSMTRRGTDVRISMHEYGYSLHIASPCRKKSN